MRAKLETHRQVDGWCFCTERPQLFGRIGAVLLVLLTLAMCACQGAMNYPRTGITMEGCITKSGDQYKLTQNSGKLYYLTGDLHEVSKSVGKDVVVRGQRVMDENTPQGPPLVRDGMLSVMAVTSADSTGRACQSGKK